MKKLVLSGLVLLSLASISLADIPRPDSKKGKKSIDTTLSINIDRDAKEAKLIIPRADIQQLRAALDAVDDDSSAGSTFATTQTIVSGALLSLALVFGGLWFARGGSKNSKAVAAAAVLLAFGSVASFVYANAGPPPEARTINGKMFTQSVHMYKHGSGKIKLEVSDEVRTPELIVPDTPRRDSDE